MNVNPCCQWCGKAYVHAKAIHAAEQDRENWFCHPQSLNCVDEVGPFQPLH